MQVVSSTEFATHQQKYFNLAHRQRVLVRSGDHMYRITPEPVVREQKILQPDDDFYRAISAEEFRERALTMASELDKKYAKR